MCQVFLSMATPKGAKAVIVTKRITFAVYCVHPLCVQYFEETDNFEMCAFHKLQRETLSCKIVGNFNQGGGGSPKR